MTKEEQYLYNKEYLLKKCAGHLCLDCGVQLKALTSIRCYSCNAKWRLKNNPDLIATCIGNLPKNPKGPTAGGYRNGCSLNPKCCDCGVPVREYRTARCKECGLIYKQKQFALEKNPNWLGGISFEPYPIGWNRNFKQVIRERDDFLCCLCGTTENLLKRKLSVHHIYYNKQNCSEDNLISLCTKCHIHTNYNRVYWQSYFQTLVKLLYTGEPTNGR